MEHVMEQYCILVLSVQDKWTGGLFVEASKVVSFTTTISHNFVTIYEQSYVSPVYLTSLLEYPLIGIKLRTVRMQGRYSQDGRISCQVSWLYGNDDLSGILCYNVLQNNLGSYQKYADLWLLHVFWMHSIGLYRSGIFCLQKILK